MNRKSGTPCELPHAEGRGKHSTAVGLKTLRHRGYRSANNRNRMMDTAIFNFQFPFFTCLELCLILIESSLTASLTKVETASRTDNQDNLLSQLKPRTENLLISEGPAIQSIISSQQKTSNLIPQNYRCLSSGILS